MARDVITPGRADLWQSPFTSFTKAPCGRMISTQTLRVCREGKPVPAFPDHARLQALNFALRLAATEAGTKAETSPPIEAIWRTSVAVIGRIGAEAGTNTVCTSGAIV